MERYREQTGGCPRDGERGGGLGRKGDEEVQTYSYKSWEFKKSAYEHSF